MNLTDIPQLRQPPTAMESEQVIIGALLLDNSVFDRISDKLRADHFFRHENRLIYAEIERQLAAGKGVDLVTVHQALADEQISLVYLNDVAQYVPSLTNVGRHADLIVAAARARSLMIACDEISLLAQDQGRGIDERVDEAQQKLAKLSEEAPRDEWVDAHDGMVLHTQVLEDRAEGRVHSWSTGLHDLDEYLEGGLRPGGLYIVGARPSMGKAQPLSAKVLTCGGWAEMGSLKVGDALASVDGKTSIVTGVFPQGDKQVFRVTFTDGRTTECCDDHLWSVNHRKWSKQKVLRTSEIRQLMKKPGMDGRLWIDSPSGDFGHTSTLPVDPWLLGAG